MCLLVKQPASSKFSDEFLRDVYFKNQDGLGVMYADGDKMHVFKCLPANAEEFVDFYRKHAEGRDCVWHARMQTHGDIDFDNCHPYKVTEDVWLAHNGVLSTSNDADKSKSDTWHFIRNVIRPALIGQPELLLDKDWQEFIEKAIGSSNKFALVRADGVVVVMNEKAGVEYQGAWLSNTYAWSYNRFTGRAGGYTNMYSGYGGYRSRFDDEYEDYYNYGIDKTTIAKGVSAKSTQVAALLTEKPTAQQVRPFIRAAFNSWMRRGVAGIEQWVFDAPHKAAAVLSFWYDDVDDIEEMVNYDPEGAAEWISDLFATDSIAPNMYQ
jgi:predicted glutamine amidotransferase